MKSILSNFAAGLFLSLFLLNISYSQKAPIKFGKVSQEDMEMTVYDKDTSVSAVILCDYGYFEPNNFIFTRTQRRKILKKEGYKYAEFSIRGDEKTRINAFSYNMVNGEIVKEKVKGESLIREKIYDDVYEIKLAIPNVKVGTVIDISYSTVGLPSNWHFQSSIPVLWSELVVPDNSYVDFKRNYFGYLPLHISDPNRWVVKDAPAFKSEAFISSEENYITRFEFELLEITFPGYYKTFCKTWDDVAKRLNESENFGRMLTDNKRGNIEPMGDLTLSGKKGKELLQLAYEKVRDRMKWDEKARMLTSETFLKKIWEKQEGNSSDINFYLMALLQKLDFEVSPLVLSTRENGLLSQMFPTIDKINYVVALVKLDGEEIMLDATEKNLPMGMLPIRCLNGEGMVIGKELKWKSLLPTQKIKSTTFYNLELDQNMVFKGTVQDNLSGYAAYQFRNEYEEFAGEKEFLKDFTEDKKGVEVTKLELKNLKELDKGLSAVYAVEMTGMVEDLGEEKMFYPLFFSKQKENPLKADERKYPIDFTYPFDETFIVRIKLPEGYEVTETPKTILMKLPDQSAQIVYQATHADGVVQLTYKLIINNVVYGAESYGELKEFFNQIVKKHSEPIILKRKG